MKLLLLCLLALTPLALAWEDWEVELFELVDEVNGTFYEYMELKPDCGMADIRKSYRRLSLLLHPDKNDAEDAEMKFRWMVGIYEVLKDKEKRELYETVLHEGLPEYKTPIYYIRRMRKIDLTEGMVYLLLIITLCQYFVNWAAYWERKFTHQEQVAAQARKLAKKLPKKGKKEGGELEEAVAEVEEEIYGAKPTVYDTLPFQLFRGGKWLALALPGMPGAIYGSYLEQKEQKAKAEKEREDEKEEIERWEREKKEKKERAKEFKRKQARNKYKSISEERENTETDDEKVKQAAYKAPKNHLQVWTDQDLAKLSKLMKKFPSGTSDRWDVIANALDRTTGEVTKMAGSVKAMSYQVSVSKASQGVTGLESKKMISDSVMEHQYNVDTEEDSTEESTDYDDENYGVTMASKDDYVPVEVKDKKKTKGGKNGTEESEEDSWSSVQQKELELALASYPKGTEERWDRIASKVEGKTKAECMLRFKSLAEMVKKKREAQD